MGHLYHGYVSRNQRVILKKGVKTIQRGFTVADEDCFFLNFTLKYGLHQHMIYLITDGCLMFFGAYNQHSH